MRRAHFGPLGIHRDHFTSAQRSGLRERLIFGVAGPHRNTVPPPQLPANAPIAQRLVPMLKCLGVARRKETNFPVAHCVARGRRAFELIGRHGLERCAAQTFVRHAHKPLIAQPRFNRHAASIAVTHGMFPRPLIFQKTVHLEPIHNRLARVLA